MVGSGFQNIFKIPELKKRIFYTLALLVVYRIGVNVPVPGIDSAALAEIFNRFKGVLGIVDLFSGGALERFSIFALGIMPYISSSIILQLLTVVVPHLERLSKEGEQGRKKITQYTRYGTVFLSIIQGFGISYGLVQGNANAIPAAMFIPLTVITLTAGTAFIMWLGEQITERGIGNGISLIIFAGIVARAPAAVGATMELVRSGTMNIFLVLILLIFMALVVAFIIFVEQGQRRIPVQYAKRVVGAGFTVDKAPTCRSRSISQVLFRRFSLHQSSCFRQRWQVLLMFRLCKRSLKHCSPEMSGTNCYLSDSYFSSAIFTQPLPSMSSMSPIT